MTSDDFFVFIPFLPPGINQQYMRSYTTGRPVLTKKAREWKENASLVVRNRANLLDWKCDAKKYSFDIFVGGARADVDAYVKTVIDVVSTCLGFDDRCLSSVSVKKLRFRKLLDLYVYDERKRIESSGFNEINNMWRNLDGVNNGIYVRVKKEK